MFQPAVVPGRIWPQLPSELAERIASCLSHNDIPCSLRLVNKAAAAQFRAPQHTTVRLSEPTPAHAFAWRWGAPDATRTLTYKQRIRLLRLTAASGIIPNMEVALASAGCLPTGKVLGAAAAAGQLHMCEFLLTKGCPSHGALSSAAQAGRRDVCMWIIDKGLVQPSEAVDAYRAAACGGHVGLMEELLRCRKLGTALEPRSDQDRPDLQWVLVGVARGCDLATLQRFHRDWLEARGDEDKVVEEEYDEPPGNPFEECAAAAACSPTPDWRAKLEWLEGQGYHKSHAPAREAAQLPDAVERLEWLRQRGYPVLGFAAMEAARAGNTAALRYLHGMGASLRGAEFHAALGGNLEAMAWLLETPGSEEALSKPLFDTAASSGNMELLAWLHARGCPWGEKVMTWATEAGNVAAIEWLAERGCPMEVDGSLFRFACHNTDLATLRCLVRLGCPWGPVGKVFSAVAGDFVPPDASNALVPMLRALLSAGCPVDWESADEWARSLSGRVQRAEVLALLAEERARRQARGPEGQGGV